MYDKGFELCTVPHVAWKRCKPVGITKDDLIHLLESNPIDHNLQGLLKHLKLYGLTIRNKGELKRFFDCIPVSTATKRRYYTALRKFPQVKPFCEFEIKAPKDEIKKDIDPFTKNELKAILQIFGPSHYGGFVYFIANTGCRPSEAIGIQWDDIEFENKRIRFHRSLSKNQLTGKREYKTTKTGKVRYTPMSVALCGHLLDWELFRDDSGRVFSTPEGSVISDSNFLAREWKPRLNSAGVRYRPLYNLRHTFISHCLSKGVDVVTVASWVGNSPEVIYNHYAGVVNQATVPD